MTKQSEVQEKFAGNHGEIFVFQTAGRMAARLAAQLDAPITGIIENLSYVACPSYGYMVKLLGHVAGETQGSEDLHNVSVQFAV